MYPEVRLVTFSPPLGGARAGQAVDRGPGFSMERRKSFLEKVEKSTDRL